MAGLTKVQIANWALNQIPAKGITALTDASESARQIAQNYDIILQMCLRYKLTPWNFATKRIQLTATNTTPVNEFSKEYELPGDCVAIQQFWPVGVAYRKEGGKLYTNATTIIIKYTSDDVLDHPERMEMDFIKYFGFALAAAMAPKLSEDSNRARELDNKAEAAYRSAASAMSMEDTPDQMPDGPWIEAHEGIMNFSKRTDSLLDLNSLP